MTVGLTFLSVILAGYGVVASFLLAAVYLISLPDMEKTQVAKLSCAALMTSLAGILSFHVLYFLYGLQPLEFRLYVLMVSIVPASYFFFSRDVLSMVEDFSWRDSAHFLLIPIAFFMPLKLGVLLSFIAGFSYTLYIFIATLRLRSEIPRYRFEKFFFAMFFIINVMVLCLGIAVQLFEPSFFYHAYTASLSLSLAVVTGALLVFPDLLSDVLLASKTVYAKSKLTNVDVNKKRDQLESLMLTERCYEDENLSLSMLAQRLELSSQQLSELVNSEFSLSFPKYVTRHRVEAAKKLLLEEPNTSVLAISMATGFKSQSNFYTAFKEHTNLAPAAYRKQNSVTEKS